MFQLSSVKNVPRVARALARRLAVESGIALPSAVLMLFIIATLMIAAAATAITANSQSNRDRSTKRAVAAAEAGIDAALSRMNNFPGGTDECIGYDGSSGEVAPIGNHTGGWCPGGDAVAEDLGANASYSYRVSAPKEVLDSGQHVTKRRIVSTGTVDKGTADPADDVKRRALADISGSTGAWMFGEMAVRSLETPELNEYSKVHGDIATNGNVQLNGNSQFCGEPYLTVSGQVIENGGSVVCPGGGQILQHLLQKSFLLPDVDQGTPSARTPAGNDNDETLGCPPFNPGQGEWCSYDSATRSLIVTNVTLTLTGNTYSFCDLQVTGQYGKLAITARYQSDPPVKIFIDDPKYCYPSSPGSRSYTVALHNPVNDPRKLQMSVVGSSDPAYGTTYYPYHNYATETAMTLYAPNSTVNLRCVPSCGAGGSGSLPYWPPHIIGAVAAKKYIATTYNQGAEPGSPKTEHMAVTWDYRVSEIEVPVIPILRRDAGTECTPLPTGSAPDSGC